MPNATLPRLPRVMYRGGEVVVRKGRDARLSSSLAREEGDEGEDEDGARRWWSVKYVLS